VRLGRAACLAQCTVRDFRVSFTSCFPAHSNLVCRGVQEVAIHRIMSYSYYEFAAPCFLVCTVIEKMNIIICVANSIVRVGVCAIVDEHPGLIILGVADSSGEALSLASHADADVMIIDDAIVGQPSALEKLAPLRVDAVDGDAALVAVTGDTSPARLCDLLRRGVRGIVSPDEPQEQLMEAVRAAADGAIYVSPGVAVLVAAAVAANVADNYHVETRTLDKLTPRELEIMDHVLRGLRNQAIADLLTVSVKTVKFHVSSVFAKLSVGSRAELIATFANAV
jgi:DNA-binding NarL/FixJ family response regulator